MPILELVDPQRNRRFRVKGDHFIIGRAEDSHGIIEGDHQVSRHHCEVRAVQDRWVLRDLNSRNGTLVKGRPIEAVKLRDGGVFQVGFTYVRFFAEEATAKKTPPANYPKDVPQAPTTTNPATVDMLDLTAVSAALAPPGQVVEVDPQPAPARPAARQAAPGNAPRPRPAPAADDGGDDAEAAYDVLDPIEVTPTADDDAPLTVGSGLQELVNADAEADGAGSPTTSLGNLLRMGRDPGFGLEGLSLVNARGQTLHAAGRDAAANQTLTLLGMLLLGSVRCAASDIHIEPRNEATTLRLRVDGTMIEVGKLSPDDTRKLTGLIKVLSDIDITRKAQVQEGRFSAGVPGRAIDYRVSLAPSMHGQKIVLRVLDPAQSPQYLDKLNLPRRVHRGLERAASRAQGVVLVCGPTGSGKTTTLYAVLRGLDAAARNVVTIEDPIEYELDSITQLPVKADRGDTYASLLRSCLRQDPDVLVIGEIRDSDTAVTAMEAATTGHLVFSSLHATDTLGTVLRLLDLDVEPYLLASTLNLILAQRLVRRLCPHCRKPTKLDEDELKEMGLDPKQRQSIFDADGCAECFHTGYHGRIGVFELLQVDDTLRDLIMSKPTLVDMRKAIADGGTVTLAMHGRERVLAGETSPEEADLVVGLQ